MEDGQADGQVDTSEHAPIGHSQRLKALGALASGVAHEINNPIQSIMNYAQLIRNRTEAGPLSEYASEIQGEAQRVATIVKNLLSFARQGGGPYAEASVLHLVQQTLSLTAAVLEREQIAVHVDISAQLPDIPCHPQQIQQVIMNLVTHGRDALNARFPTSDSRKRIEIRAELIEDAGTGYLRTRIQDFGDAMEQTRIERAFDPLSGDHGNWGSALGLAVSRAIVTDHGGRLQVRSEPGERTCFCVDLPLERTP